MGISPGTDVVALSEILSPWEKKFCEWMVEKFPASVKKSDQAKACTALAGREVTELEISKLRQRRAYRRYYTELKIASTEAKNEGMAIFQATIPQALKLQQKAVKQMLKDDTVDIRAVPSIVAPFNDYVAPKKQLTETHATVVTINITANQQASLDSPIMEVEAEEVTTEIVP